MRRTVDARNWPVRSKSHCSTFLSYPPQLNSYRNTSYFFLSFLPQKQIQYHTTCFVLKSYYHSLNSEVGRKPGRPSLPQSAADQACFPVTPSKCAQSHLDSQLQTTWTHLEASQRLLTAELPARPTALAQLFAFEFLTSIRPAYLLPPCARWTQSKESSLLISADFRDTMLHWLGSSAGMLRAQSKNCTKADKTAKFE